MDVGLVAGALWVVVSLYLTVAAALAGGVTQAVLWGVVTVIAVVCTVSLRGASGPARV